MIELPCSLVIEATNEPDYFGFYSPDLEGFPGSATPWKIACSRRNGACWTSCNDGRERHVHSAEIDDPTVLIMNSKGKRSALRRSR